VSVASAQLFDTMLAARLVRPEWQRVDLSTLAKDYLGFHLPEFKELFGAYPNFAHAPLEIAAPYAAADAYCTWHLYQILLTKLAELKLEKVFFELEMPLMTVILQMETAGIGLDCQVLQQLNQKLIQQMHTAELKIRASLQAMQVPQAHSINLLSPKQVEQVLFDELKLAPGLKGKSGSRSTGKDVLEELAKLHPIPNMILGYRRLAKLQNTYLEALPAQIHPRSGKVHTAFLQARVATGRLSSIDPNLQNIPPLVRSAFVADAGSCFVAADYSQIELRILAHLSGDEQLLQAFAAGADVHVQTAAQIFNCQTDQVTAEQRQIGKRINFSVIYGLSAFSLARELNLNRNLAQEYIDAFFVRYQGVRQWMEQLIASTKELGYTKTIMGRRRYFPDINDRNKMLSAAAQRAAINSVVQGTAAEIIKLAMVQIANKLALQPALGQILLQVHDELLLQAPLQHAQQLRELVVATMQQVMTLKVVLEVSSKVGSNWGQVSK
jgi:DNA polymerase-1